MSAPAPTAALAERILAAARGGERLAALSAQPGFTLDEAYRVQFALADRRGAASAPVGWKIGLSNRARWAELGASEPFFGHLFADMETLPGEAISLAAANLRTPRLEPEIAFVLERPLQGPGVTVAQVLAATAGVMAALEIIDHRVEPRAVTDFVADNGAAARFVLSGRLVPVNGLDLRLVGVVLERSGLIAATAAGAACFGHPAATVAWLANKLAAWERSLEAGSLVLSGSLAVVPVRAGDAFTAHFDRLGAVSVRFED